MDVLKLQLKLLLEFGPVTFGRAALSSGKFGGAVLRIEVSVIGKSHLGN